MLAGINSGGSISEITQYIKPSHVTHAMNFLTSKSLEKSSITLFGSPASGSYGFTLNPGVLSHAQRGTAGVQIALQYFYPFYPSLGADIKF